MRYNILVFFADLGGRRSLKLEEFLILVQFEVGPCSVSAHALLYPFWRCFFVLFAGTIYCHKVSVNYALLVFLFINNQFFFFIIKKFIYLLIFLYLVNNFRGLSLDLSFGFNQLYYSIDRSQLLCILLVNDTWCLLRNIWIDFAIGLLEWLKTKKHFIFVVILRGGLG